MSKCTILTTVAVTYALLLTPALTPATAQQDDASAKQWAGTLLAPKAFRAAADKVAPSLVSIEAFAGVSGLGQGRIGGIKKQGEGNTTGVVISSDGYIITSTFNFIRDQRAITVFTHDGKQHIAEIVGRDHTRKICILKIKNVNDLVVPELVPVDKITVGQWAVSVGVGYGDTNPAISAGIISAKNRIAGRAIQTDANISPANYGGPLIDVEGRVLGICAPMSPNSQELAAGVNWYDSGIGFAIPLAGAETLIAKLKSGKDIHSAWLGISAKAAEEGKTGISVEKIAKNSPAEKAKMKSGDIILKLGDKPTENMQELKQALQRFVEDDQSKITVQREGKKVELDVVFSARPKNAPAMEVQPKGKEKPKGEGKEQPKKKDEDETKKKDEPKENGKDKAEEKIREQPKEQSKKNNSAPDTPEKSEGANEQEASDKDASDKSQKAKQPPIPEAKKEPEK